MLSEKIGNYFPLFNIFEILMDTTQPKLYEVFNSQKLKNPWVSKQKVIDLYYVQY